MCGERTMYGHCMVRPVIYTYVRQRRRRRRRLHNDVSAVLGEISTGGRRHVVRTRVCSARYALHTSSMRDSVLIDIHG